MTYLHSRRSQRGMNLVEVLVALVLGLLVSVVALGSAQSFSGISRNQTGQGSALASASVALDALRQDIQLSGLGFFSDTSPLCPRINASFNGDLIGDGQGFAPLAMTAQGTGSDRIELVHAGDVTAGSAFKLLASMSQPMAPVMVRSGVQIQTGDAVLLSNAAANQPCTLASAGTLTAVAGGRIELAFNVPGGFTPADWGNAFSDLPSYSEQASLSVLRSLNWIRYELSADRLEREDVLTGQRSVIARGIVQMRAQYGLAATSTDNMIDSWVDAQSGGGLSAGDWSRLRALRVAVVAVNGEPQRPDTNGQCDATAVAPALWPGESAAVTQRAQWQCSRYRVWSTWVALPNLQWGQGR